MRGNIINKSLLILSIFIKQIRSDDSSKNSASDFSGENPLDRGVTNAEIKMLITDLKSRMEEIAGFLNEIEKQSKNGEITDLKEIKKLLDRIVTHPQQ